MQDYWIKQGSEPAYPDLLWSRPVNKKSAGKLLIIGGNLHGFNAVASAYSTAQTAGAGSIRLILPGALQELLGKVIPEAEFVPSTASGSFAKSALAEIIDLVSWADTVLLAGEFGKNSETAILLENLTDKISIPLVIVSDSNDVLFNQPDIIIKSNTLSVIDFSQLQKLATKTHFTKAFTSNMTILKYVETLHEFSLDKNIGILTAFESQFFVADRGKISSTKSGHKLQDAAASASVWFMQNPDKMFEAVTTSLITMVGEEGLEPSRA